MKLCSSAFTGGPAALLLIVAGGALAPAAQNETNGEAVEFNRDIRPILSDKCYTCHGPDKANRKTKLRFDVESGAKADLGGRFAIVPGDPSRSEMVRRITASNKALRMPPAYSGVTLTPREIELIQRWIQQGAKWEKHWSFLPPKHPPLPQVRDTNWPRNGIDRFVLARLEREGLAPSPEADRATLIRRVTLDLTGLPPTPAEVDAFLKDSSPQAYEKVVDRLLASARYGERMAVRWLDAARYADTNGYQTDGERIMWRWRDWVIDAFNRNMPFDQFTVEQIAGDMLPNATLDQRIATGFNRNHRGNGEGGIIPEEYAVEYVVDRVDTTATVFLGLTLGCARCHDHKYDPFTQKEFYQVFAYFNNIPEKGKAWKYGNSPPLIQAPTAGQQAELAALDRQLNDAEAAVSRIEPKRIKSQRKWEKKIRGRKDLRWSISDGLEARYALDGSIAGEIPNGPAGKKPEPRVKDGQARFAAGPQGQAVSLDGKSYIEAGDVANFGFYDKFTLAAWVRPAASDGAILARSRDAAEPAGYSLLLKNGKVQVNLAVRWLDDALRVETAQPIALDRWHQITATYDGSRVADGVKVWVDGEPQKLNYLLDELNQDFSSKEPLRIGAGGGPEYRFRGEIADVHLYRRVLTPAESAVMATAAPIDEIARKAPGQRLPAESNKLAWCFIDTAAPKQIQETHLRLRTLRHAREKLVASFPTVMVMQERPVPRETHVLIRGAYDKPGEKVTPGLPAVLPPLPPGAPNNRLGFARWLVDPSNPLTARVTVNRFWQSYFGTGLVKTVEDFGSQGEWPSHPELLDWLATEFVRSGWNVKAMQKLIVTSATYRQSSRIRPDLLQKDPDNRLLARGPRFRLPAEAIRDQALAISGLLVERVGGPSVKPYQPAGLWKELSGGDDYKQGTGPDLYRRSLYTFWKRTVPPPAMMNFDAAGREMCIVRETRTNTPLQALNLMNDVTFVEAARVLAERMMKEGGSNPAERIAYGFRLATAHAPDARRSRVLLESFRHYLNTYRENSKAAVELISTGESPCPDELDRAELAAYTTVASLILNLDEVVSKE